MITTKPVKLSKSTIFNLQTTLKMKTIVKNAASLFTVLFFITGLLTFTFANTNNPDNMLTPVEKKGKYAKLDVSSLPYDKDITVRVRDHSERLVDEFKIRNTGQQHVLVNFNRLKPGLYSLNILRGEKDVVRKILDIHWNQVAVNNVITMSRDSGQENRWPLYMVR